MPIDIDIYGNATQTSTYNDVILYFVKFVVILIAWLCPFLVGILHSVPHYNLVFIRTYLEVSIQLLLIIQSISWHNYS